MRILTFAALSFFSTLLQAQGLQLTTVIVHQPSNYVSGSGKTIHLPVGTVPFPLSAAVPGAYATLGRTGSVLTMAHTGQVNSFGYADFDISGDLLTRVSMPLPARVRIAVEHRTLVQEIGSVGSLPAMQAGVDLGADGTDEFADAQVPNPNWGWASRTATLSIHCDASDALVRWHQCTSQGPIPGSGVMSGTSELILDFEEPIQEPAYGQTCAGALGCQLGDAPYDRIFVASFPGGTTFAWLMGGDRQWNVQFPNFPCPLLVEPQLILAVPLDDGPNGRRFVDFEATFPPIPGLTFYAQGIAISGGTFLGTNGVIVQT